MLTRLATKCVKYNKRVPTKLSKQSKLSNAQYALYSSGTGKLPAIVELYKQGKITEAQLDSALGTTVVSGLPKFNTPLVGKVGRLAKELFEQGFIQKEISQVTADVKEFMKYKGSRAFLAVVDDWNVEEKEKITTFAKKVSRVDESTPIFKDFLYDTIQQQKNMKDLFPALELYLKLDKEYNKEEDVTVITPRPLDQRTLDYYGNKVVSEVLGHGYKLTITNKVDPSLIRGYKLIVGDMYEAEKSWHKEFQVWYKEIKALPAQEAMEARRNECKWGDDYMRKLKDEITKESQANGDPEKLVDMLIEATP